MQLVNGLGIVVPGSFCLFSQFQSEGYKKRAFFKIYLELIGLI